MRYKAAIFDLDGTLLDTLRDINASLNLAMSSAGRPYRTREQVRKDVGRGARKLIEDSLGPATDTEVASALTTFRDHYLQHCDAHSLPYPGITDTLLELRSRGVMTAVATNKPRQAALKLCHRHLASLLDVIIGETPDLKPKPAPDIVEKAIEALGLQKSECLYIGDSETDIHTARNAGMPCLSAGWGFRTVEELNEAGAAILLTTPADILDFFSF